MMVKSWWCVRCENIYWKVYPEVVHVIQVKCRHVLFHMQLWIVSKWLKVQVKANLSQQYHTGGDELLFSVGCLCYKLMLASRMQWLNIVWWWYFLPWHASRKCSLSLLYLSYASIWERAHKKYLERFFQRKKLIGQTCLSRSEQTFASWAR